MGAAKCLSCGRERVYESDIGNRQYVQKCRNCSELRGALARSSGHQAAIDSHLVRYAIIAACDCVICYRHNASHLVDSARGTMVCALQTAMLGDDKSLVRSPWEMIACCGDFVPICGKCKGSRYLGQAIHYGSCVTSLAKRDDWGSWWMLMRYALDRTLEENGGCPLPEPTAAPRGSAEKIEVLRRRAERGEELFHDDDALEVDGRNLAMQDVGMISYMWFDKQLPQHVYRRHREAMANGRQQWERQARRTGIGQVPVEILRDQLPAWAAEEWTGPRRHYRTFGNTCGMQAS